MNVPMNYDDEAECLRTPPLLLHKRDKLGTMTTADKIVLKKTNDKISFAPDVSFAQRTSLRPQVPRTKKTQGTRCKSTPQRMTHQVAPPLVHLRNVLGSVQ